MNENFKMNDVSGTGMKNVKGMQVSGFRIMKLVYWEKCEGHETRGVKKKIVKKII